MEKKDVSKDISFVNENLKWGYIADATMYYNGVFEPQIADWTTKDETNWPDCSIIELTNRDIRGISHEGWSEFSRKLKEKEIKLTAHDSFLRNDFYDPKTKKSLYTCSEFFKDKALSKQGNILNLFWYTIPEDYNSPLPLYQKSIEQGFEDIDFAAENGADRMTIHVTKPGSFLNMQEFEDYISCWKELNAYGQKWGVDILVETGGVSEDQMLELKNRGAKFNLDTAHALIDGMDVLSVYHKIKDSILEMHLSMTKDNKDFHEGIDYIGEGYSPELRKINAEMVRQASEKQKSGEDIALVLEVKPSLQNVTFLYDALRGED